MPTRVLLTGANGFIGRSLLARLLSRGDLEVICPVRATARLRGLEKTGARLAVVDWSSPDELAPLVAEAGVVIHLAGTVAALSPQGYLDGNLGITRSLARCLASHGRTGQRLVYVSSQAAAGPWADPPGRNEDHPPRPVSAYGKAKLAAEAEVLALAPGRPVTVLRPAIVYGPGDRALLPLFRAARRMGAMVPGHGRRAISLIYLDDLTRALERAALGPGLPAPLYLVSDGAAHTWRELAQAIGRAVGGPGRVLPTPWWLLRALCGLEGWRARRRGRPRALGPDKWLEASQAGWLCDSSRARRDLDLREMVGLEEGLARTARWYGERGWL